MHKENKRNLSVGYRVTCCTILKINFKQPVRNTSNFILLYKILKKSFLYTAVLLISFRGMSNCFHSTLIKLIGPILNSFPASSGTADLSSFYVGSVATSFNSRTK